MCWSLVRDSRDLWVGRSNDSLGGAVGGPDLPGVILDSGISKFLSWTARLPTGRCPPLTSMVGPGFAGQAFHVMHRLWPHPHQPLTWLAWESDNETEVPSPPANGWSRVPPPIPIYMVPGALDVVLAAPFLRTWNAVVLFSNSTVFLLSYLPILRVTSSHAHKPPSPHSFRAGSSLCLSGPYLSPWWWWACSLVVL